MEFLERLALGRKGDRGAAEALFERWRPLLRLQARDLLGQELSARVDPSDVVQEALTQAFQSLAQFRGTSEAEWVTWLQTQVAGHACKLSQHHHAQKRDLSRGQPIAGDLPLRDGSSVGDGVIRREEALRLAEALDQLPVAMREVVVRRVFHQEPFESVAQALGVSPGAARVTWTRALRKLRELLDTV